MKAESNKDDNQLPIKEVTASKTAALKQRKLIEQNAFTDTPKITATASSGDKSPESKKPHLDGNAHCKKSEQFD